MESNVSDATTGEISRQAQTVAFFEWKILNFSRLPKEVDHSVASPKFSFLDAEWNLSLYPNGEKDCSKWMCLYLMRVRSIAQCHYVGYRLGIRKKDGSEYGTRSSQDCFGKDASGWGGCVLSKSSLTASLRLEIVPEDTMTIFCFLHSNACDTFQTEGINRLSSDFRNLLATEIDTDVTLQIKDKIFRIHKTILRARSPVFDSMFTHNMTEKISGTVDIPDCDPVAFRHFLTYLYSASTDNLSSDVVFNLYFIAQKYCVEELKRKCVEFMFRNLSVDMFFDVVALSWQHEDATLLQIATEFFTKNTKEVITSVQWQSFLKDYPVAANEFYIKSIESRE